MIDQMVSTDIKLSKICLWFKHQGEMMNLKLSIEIAEVERMVNSHSWVDSCTTLWIYMHHMRSKKSSLERILKLRTLGTFVKTAVAAWRTTEADFCGHQTKTFFLTLLSMRANLYFLAMAFKGLKLELLLLVEEFAKKYHKNVQPSNLLFNLFF